MPTWKRILIRSAGFGAGFAITAALIVGAVLWWQHRPKPWSSNAVTAKIGELAFQQLGEDLHITFQYALTNNTKEDYRLPQPLDVALMRTLKESGSIENVDSFGWQSVMVPSHQTVSVTFEVIYPFSDFGTNAEELYGPNNPQREITNKFTKFVNERLQVYRDGFAFLDPAKKYRIELPSDWQGLIKGP